MTAPFSARLWREGSCFLAGCHSLGLVAEGLTREEALGNLRTAVSLYVDGPVPQMEVAGPLGDGP